MSLREKLKDDGAHLIMAVGKGGPGISKAFCSADRIIVVFDWKKRLYINKVPQVVDLL